MSHPLGVSCDASENNLGVCLFLYRRSSEHGNIPIGPDKEFNQINDYEDKSERYIAAMKCQIIIKIGQFSIISFRSLQRMMTLCTFL